MFTQGEVPGKLKALFILLDSESLGAAMLLRPQGPEMSARHSDTPALQRLVSGENLLLLL